MFISKTAISRRRVLRGMGAGLALPLLDAMVPALTPTVKTAAAARKRLGCVYIPHGCIMDRWTPAAKGAGFEFTPILKPLEPFRDSLVIVTNMTRPEQGVDTNHAGAPASWLAGVPPKRTAGPDYRSASRSISWLPSTSVSNRRFHRSSWRLKTSAAWSATARLDSAART